MDKFLFKKFHFPKATTPNDSQKKKRWQLSETETPAIPLYLVFVFELSSTRDE